MLGNIDEVNRYLNERLLELPPEYVTRWEAMKYMDFKILNDYLGQQDVVLFPDEIKVLDVRDIIDHHKNMKEIAEKNIGPLIKKCQQRFPEGYSHLMGDSEPEMHPIKSILSLPERSSKILESRKITFEAILAYAKKIAHDSRRKPIDIVQSKDGRKEIIRQIYPTKENYLDCERTGLLEEAKQTSALQDMLGMSYIGHVERGEYTIEEAKSKLGNTPSKGAMGELFEKNWKFYKKEADEIYR